MFTGLWPFTVSTTLVMLSVSLPVFWMEML